MNTQYHILIVDDDVNIRTGLQKMIESEFREEAIIYTSDNGLSAMRFLEHTQADVIVTDIKMPLATGIDLLEFLKKNKLPCKTIVLSGYDDYNLVRDALKLGAIDYLLKPVDIGLLTNTVRNALNAISLEHDNEVSPVLAHHSMQLLIEHFVLQTSMANSDVNTFAQQHEITSETKCVLGYVNIKNVLYSKRLDITNLLDSKLQTFSDALKSKNVITICGELNSYWVFLTFLPKFTKFPTDAFIPFLNQLEKEHLQISFYQEIFLLKDISTARKQCKKGFERYYFDLPYEEVSVEDYEKSLKLLVEQTICDVAEYNYSKAIDHLTSIFALFSTTRPPISEIQKVLSDLVYDLLSKNSKYIPIISSSKFTEYDILEQIETAESLAILQKQVIAALNHYIEEVLSSLADKDDYIIQKAKEYIKTNYNDNLTLGDVAAHVFLHSNYFSTLFKVKTGITFRTYLRTYRIEKSKELIQNGKLKVYEVAQAVGYNEPAHFVRAFKEVTGSSPSKYRGRL